jgi:hypothetical protein
LDTIISLDIKMPNNYHQDVRTTLTLDDDIAARLAAEARRTGRSFKDTVNDALRGGLDAQSRPQVEPFRVHARNLGNLRAGVSLDSVTRLLDDVDGPAAQ